MKKYDDLSYKEIAELLGISINTVKTQMKRALKSLSEKLSYLVAIIFFFMSLSHKVVFYLSIIFKGTNNIQ